MTNHIESEVLSEGLMTIYYIDYFGLSEGFMTNHIDYFGLSEGFMTNHIESEVLSEGFMTNHIEYCGLSEGSVAIPMKTTDFLRFPRRVRSTL